MCRGKEGKSFLPFISAIVHPYVIEFQYASLITKAVSSLQLEDNLTIPLMLQMGEQTDWEKEEKHHGRGDYSHAHYGWSYGKGQPQPQRLGGPRQEMMREFISKPSTQCVTAFQRIALISLQVLLMYLFTLSRPFLCRVQACFCGRFFVIPYLVIKTALAEGYPNYFGQSTPLQCHLCRNFVTKYYYIANNHVGASHLARGSQISHFCLLAKSVIS